MNKTQEKNVWQYDFPQLLKQTDIVVDHLNALMLTDRPHFKLKNADTLAALDGDIKLLLSELDTLKIRMKIYRQNVGDALGKRRRKERIRAMVQFIMRFNLKRMFKETREKVAKSAVAKLQAYIAIDETEEEI